MQTKKKVMIATHFREQIEKGLGCVVVLAGSGSDEAHLDKVTESLRKYGIPHQVRIASAHKQGDVLQAIIDEYDCVRGPLAYIAVAGKTDALSGTVSFRSTRPTISCPPDAPNQSCLTNPPRSSNATIYDPTNAARFIAQIFSHSNVNYRDALLGEIEGTRSKLVQDDQRLREKYDSLQRSAE